jgi:hypothetical protein
MNSNLAKSNKRNSDKRENFKLKAAELQEFVANADESVLDYKGKLQVLTKEKDEPAKKINAYKIKESRLTANETYM